MDSLKRAINKVFKGAAKSFDRFPAAVGSGMVISIIAIIRITMGWELEKPYNFLFDSLQISFVLGAVFSMAMVALDEIKAHREKSFFMITNISGLLLAGLSFLLLYFFGGNLGEAQLMYLTSIGLARVSAAIFISAVAYLYIISESKAVNGFSHGFFITHKAFVVSGIYGLAIMIGVSGVLGAFGALIYQNMDYRVYQYLGVVVGFLTYIIFLGYFPSFKEMESDTEMEKMKEQPSFIVVLLDYILIPIMIALTAVLLVWSGKVLLQGSEYSFNGLSGIASSYVISGIWLHIMVANHETKIAEFYKRSYAFAGLLILAFKAWALFVQIKEFGLKTPEYSFLMVWIFALISLVLLILLEHRAYPRIAITAAVIAFIWVLPVVGYQDLTFNSQVKNLEKTLINEEILVGDQIIAKEGDLGVEIRSQITESVDYISYSEKVNKPSWFSKNLNDGKTFKDTFGFEKTYGAYPGDKEHSSNHFRLEADLIDVSDYDLSVNINVNENTDQTREFKGEAGNYEIMISSESMGVPKIAVWLDKVIIIEEDMNQYLSDLVSKYPAEGYEEFSLPLEEMSLMIEKEELSLFIVANNIDAYYNTETSQRDYYVNFHGIYIRLPGQ